MATDKQYVMITGVRRLSIVPGRSGDSNNRMILHIDMDAFYAAVEQRDDVELQHRAVIVGGPASSRGVVCAASYEARQYGIHSAMPMATALRLCPHAVVLPPRMSVYAGVSKRIREIFFRYTPLVEPLSLDEAFLDVTPSEKLFGPAVEIGRRIKSDIRIELNLVASVGVAPNKFLAKVASDLEKPDGFCVVDPSRVQDFLDPLPIERLWGIGDVGKAKLHRLGIRTIAQLRKLPAELLQASFGDPALQLLRLAKGIDDRAVVPDREAKSLSHEMTLAEDVIDPVVSKAILLELADQVSRRLRRQGLQGKVVHLKVRFADFRTLVRSRTLANTTNVTTEIYDVVKDLFQLVEASHLPVRLLGVGVSQLSDKAIRQQLLFDEVEHQTQSRADAAADAIRDKFGADAVQRASGLWHRGFGKRDETSRGK